jgi:hypothetical protein
MSGVVHDADNEEVGPTTSIRFVLDTVVKAKDLRAGSVLAASADGEDQSGAQMKKEDFVARARGECG